MTTANDTDENILRKSWTSVLFDTNMSIIRDLKKSGKMNLDVLEYIKRSAEILVLLKKLDSNDLPQDSEFSGLSIDELNRKAKSDK